MLHYQENVSLLPYNSFGIDVRTRQFVEVQNLADLKTVLAAHRHQAFRVLGEGSNMLLTKDYEGLTVQLNLKGIEVIQETEQEVWVEAQAGENWHFFVLWCLEQNYGGVENLALIPGSVGAAPIQNIGAYGVELEAVVQQCNTLEVATLEAVTFQRDKCAFGYRESIFKNQEKGTFIITSVVFKLQKAPHQTHTEYGALKTLFGDKNPSIQEVAQAVINIRQSKLPDPKDIGNSGSFFKNPIIAEDQFKRLQKNFPQLPFYPNATGYYKIPAAWLIDTLGFKGYREGDAGVHENQALVLVNHGKASGSEILTLSKKIQNAVQEKFEISLETEVNIL